MQNANAECKCKWESVIQYLARVASSDDLSCQLSTFTAAVAYPNSNAGDHKVIKVTSFT